MSFDEDNDFGGSQDASSDEEQNNQNDQDEDMDDAEADGDEDPDAEDDDDVEAEAGGESEDEGERDDISVLDPQRQGQTSVASGTPGPLIMPTSGDATGDPLTLAPSTPLHQEQKESGISPSAEQDPSVTVDSSHWPAVRPEALTAAVYDIVPTVAAPHSTSINAIAATPDMRWVFSGGSDGYIRKFNWVDTANARLMLTVAQRHPFVDSVTKAGVLVSYWENDEPEAKPNDDGQIMSPVHSLAVHNKALWLLSGLESGGINLQAVRHEEGKRIHYFKKHTSAVSVLQLAQDERSVLSGSWDKTILDWDLNTGQVIRAFEGSGGQISAIETRPFSSLPVPETYDFPALTNGTLSTNNADKPLANGLLPNGIGHDAELNGIKGEEGATDARLSPAHSLSSLFGDNGDDNTGGPSFGDDNDDLFSGAVPNLEPEVSEDAQSDVNMGEAPTMSSSYVDGVSTTQESASTLAHADPFVDSTTASLGPLLSGLPHAEDIPIADATASFASTSDQPPTADSTFLSASFDGSLRIWDKRQHLPAARISPRAPTPPWCMGACWSPDGNFIYAGRRNGTVEEYSLHGNLNAPARTFRFPNGSGPVSAVRAMPNSKHLICASFDILRLYDLKHDVPGRVPFLIVPGHRTGVVSSLYLDPTCRYMISTAGNRGWEGTSTQVLLGYEVGI